MDYVNQARLKKLRMRVEADTQFLPGCKKLKMRGKELDDLPAELFVMTDLEVLDLSPERQSCINYHCTEIPSAISRLSNLKILMLDTNVITQLPDAITQLVNLQKLSLSNNSLTYLPDDFGKLKSLQSLHLANNDFEKFPECICELSNLFFLDMCDNRLSALPDSIKSIKKLETLMLYLNCLTALPDGICDLVELRSLWIGGNQIIRLPRQFTKLQKLDWGQRHNSSCVIDKNPMKQPPMYVCKQGIPAIESYFKVTEPQKTNVHPNKRLLKAPDDLDNKGNKKNKDETEGQKVTQDAAQKEP